MMGSRVFLMNVEVFGNVVKHCLGISFQQKVIVWQKCMYLQNSNWWQKVIVTESAKRHLAQAVRMTESLSNVSNFLIYLYCEWKASEIFPVHFFRCSKMRRGGCSLTSTLKLITKLLKDFSTHISQVSTYQGSEKASSRVKHSDFSKPTPLKQPLKLLFHYLKWISSKEGILKLSFQQLSQKLHLRRENLPYNRKLM